MLSVRGPFGVPWPVEELEGLDVVFGAGGIGLPPLRPAILRMLARRERYGRLILMYGGREPGPAAVRRGARAGRSEDSR